MGAKKRTQRITLLLIMLALAATLVGCETGGGAPIRSSSVSGPGSNVSGKSDPAIQYKDVLRVYNASEYMDRTTITDFEREFAVKVEYAEFEDNESMYEKITANLNAYDVLVPSDYTIDRLVKEGKLAKLDKSKVTNIANIADEYLKPAYDPDNDYVVPYMVGTLGILYNKRLVSAPIDSWAALFDSQYSGKVLMLDSLRDSIGATLKLLGFSVNASGDAELAQAKTKMQSARYTVFPYLGSEEIRDRLVAGEGTLGVLYSGDAKIAIDRNPDLAYVIPNEGSNKWVDGFVIAKNTQHIEAAHNFINFMCRPNIAVRNMAKIGYTSPVKGAWAEFNANKIMFPSAEELSRCEAFLYDAQATLKYDRLWSEVR